MNHRLCLIEGLPCAGKSTTSAFVADLLEARHAACLADEGSGNHPADFEFHAFLSKHAEKWQYFSAAYTESVSMQSDLTDISVVWKNGNVVNCKFFQGCRSNI